MRRVDFVLLFIPRIKQSLAFRDFLVAIGRVWMNCRSLVTFSMKEEARFLQASINCPFSTSAINSSATTIYGMMYLASELIFRKISTATL